MTKKPVHALVDGDLYLYRCAFVNQTKQEDGTYTAGEAEQWNAELDFANTMDYIQNKLGADRLSIVLSSSKNYRKELDENYKSNRKDSARPKLLSYLRNHIVEAYGSDVLMIDRLEADDILGILATTGQTEEERVIVSYDKDMRQLPGIRIFDTFHETDFVTDPVEAERWFWTQCLTGDATDGYYGAPGIGPKRAEVLVAGLMELPTDEAKWAYIVDIYAKKNLPADYALRQARLAYILREGDFDLLDGTVRLFNGFAREEIWF